LTFCAKRIDKKCHQSTAIYNNRHQQPDAHDGGGQISDNTDEGNVVEPRRGPGDDDQGRADDQGGDDGGKPTANQL
jgi:hypothetical protein